MKHKFAYFVMFWMPVHLTYSTIFLVRNVLIGGEPLLVFGWLRSVVLAAAVLVYVVPSRFREIIGEDFKNV